MRLTNKFRSDSQTKQACTICIAFSRGGHYLEAMRACKYVLDFPNCNIVYLTYRLSHSDDLDRETYFVRHPKHGYLLTRLFSFAINFAQSLVFFLRLKPSVIVSTGADVTFSLMLIAKIFCRKVIYIESGANVTQPSLTGRLVYPFADLFLVQWEELLSHYPKALYGGPLL